MKKIVLILILIFISIFIFIGNCENKEKEHISFLSEKNKLNIYKFYDIKNKDNIYFKGGGGRVGGGRSGGGRVGGGRPGSIKTITNSRSRPGSEPSKISSYDNSGYGRYAYESPRVYKPIRWNGIDEEINTYRSPFYRNNYPNWYYYINPPQQIRTKFINTTNTDNDEWSRQRKEQEKKIK